MTSYSVTHDQADKDNVTANELVNALIKRLTDRRETLWHAAQETARSYLDAVRQRQTQAGPRSQYCPLAIMPRRRQNSIDLAWYVRHRKRAGQGWYIRRIPKKKKHLYDRKTLEKHLAEWYADLVEETERKAAKIRAEYRAIQEILAALRQAMRKAARLSEP